MEGAQGARTGRRPRSLLTHASAGQVCWAPARRHRRDASRQVEQAWTVSGWSGGEARRRAERTQRAIRRSAARRERVQLLEQLDLGERHP